MKRILGVGAVYLLLACLSTLPSDSSVLVPRAAAGAPAAAFGRPGIDTEAELRRAWADPRRTRIDLTGDIVLRNCRIGDPIRSRPTRCT